MPLIDVEEKTGGIMVCLKSWPLKKLKPEGCLIDAAALWTKTVSFGRLVVIFRGMPSTIPCSSFGHFQR